MEKRNRIKDIREDESARYQKFQNGEICLNSSSFGYINVSQSEAVGTLNSLRIENTALRERIKMLERDLTIARECIEMFMVCDPSDSFRVKAEDESDEYHTGTEAIERIDAALAGGKE